MPVIVSILFVDEVLGHSVIYKEHRENYGQARRIADRALEAARQGNAPAVLAEGLLAPGRCPPTPGRAAIR